MCQCWVRHQVLFTCVLSCTVLLSNLLLVHYQTLRLPIHLATVQQDNTTTESTSTRLRFRRQPDDNITDDNPIVAFTTKSWLSDEDNQTTVLIEQLGITTTPSTTASSTTTTTTVKPVLTLSYTDSNDGLQVIKDRIDEFADDPVLLRLDPQLAEQRRYRNFVLLLVTAISFTVSCPLWYLLVSKCGTRLPFALGLIMSGVCTCLYPFLQSWTHCLWSHALLRSLVAIVAASTLPTMGAVIRIWASIRTRNQFLGALLLSFSLAPAYIFAMASGLDILTAPVWIISVVQCVVSAVCAIGWVALQRDQPHRHPFITGQEIDRLLTGKGRMLFEDSADGNDTPWIQMLSSMPVIAMFVNGLARGVVYTWMLFIFPMIMRRECVVHACTTALTLPDVGMYMASAFLAHFGLAFICLMFVERMRFKRDETLKAKSFTAMSNIACALFLAGMAALPLIGEWPEFKARFLIVSILFLALDINGLWHNLSTHARQFTPQLLCMVAGSSLGFGLIIISLLYHYVPWHFAQLGIATGLMVSLLIYLVLADGQPAKWTGATNLYDALGRITHRHTSTGDKDDTESIEAGILEMKIIPPNNNTD